MIKMKLVLINGMKFKLSMKFLNKIISKCPATMLAVNRMDKVMGRIKFLMSSIRTMKFIRKIGVSLGKR